MKTTVLSYVAALLLLLVCNEAHADRIGVNVSTLGQVRQTENGQRNVPVNAYFGLYGADSKRHFGGETNMALLRYYDIANGINDYDLYQAVLHFQPIKELKIDFGRQFISQGFSASVIDGLMLTVLPQGYVDVALYTGIPRDIEVSDFNRDDGLLTGLSVSLKNVPRTNASFHAAWRKNSIDTTDLKQNDEILVGADASHQWTVKTKPMVYGLIEYDTTAKMVRTGTAGLDLYPTRRISLNMEFDYFNINRDTTRPTILGLFTDGRMMMGRFSSTWKLIPGWLDFIENYSFQRVTIPGGGTDNAHVLDAAVRISIADAGLYIQPGYYFIKSYGGHLQGARMNLHGRFLKNKLYVDLASDFTIYKKITNDDDNAFSTVIWTGYEVVKGLTLSTGFEYNRNNLFTEDIRGSFGIEYRYDHKS